MKINIKRLFGQTISERGYGYYRQKRVSNLLKCGDEVSAYVQGTHRYKVRINTEKDTFHCNCPYEGMCKHLAALCYEVNNRKSIKSVAPVEKKLAGKSKEELVRVLTLMLSENPELHVYLLSNDEQLRKRIAELDEEGEEWQEPYEYIPERVSELVEKIKGKENLLFDLLKKVVSIYRRERDYEDEIYYVLEELRKTNNVITSHNKKYIEQKIQMIMGKDYKQFLSTDEDDRNDQ